MKAADKTPKDDKWKQKYKEPEPVNSDNLPQLPDGWCWVRAEQICDFITKGTTPLATEMFENCGDVPFVKVYNLTNTGKLDFSVNPTFISKETHQTKLARSKLFPGDVIMNIVGPPLGKVAIVPNDYAEWNMNQAVVVYRGIPGIDNDCFCYCLLSIEILSSAIKAAKATAGQFNLTLEICRNLPLPLFSTQEQQEIVNRIDKLFKIADNIEHLYQQTETDLETLNQSILAKAFRGELVPQNPNDEPASVLLERIRKERETHSKPAKQTRKKPPKTDNNNSTQLTLEGIE
ncbi:restriction endonuclease subunit S [Limnoraphis robusta]|uniref:restriction endonuclease subunit S n=1 Tax=Limnoraphis robusta TaxID=1118279 RepID=UPI00066DE3D6